MLSKQAKLQQTLENSRFQWPIKHFNEVYFSKRAMKKIIWSLFELETFQTVFLGRSVRLGGSEGICSCVFSEVSLKPAAEVIL